MGSSAKTCTISPYTSTGILKDFSGVQKATPSFLNFHLCRNFRTVYRWFAEKQGEVKTIPRSWNWANLTSRSSSWPFWPRSSGRPASSGSRSPTRRRGETFRKFLTILQHSENQFESQGEDPSFSRAKSILLFVIRFGAIGHVSVVIILILYRACAIHEIQDIKWSCRLGH